MNEINKCAIIYHNMVIVLLSNTHIINQEEKMIKASEAKDILINLLKESKFDFNNPDPKLAYQTFKNFSSMTVDCQDDALLFQCGVYDFTGEDLFYFEFVRQFIFKVDGEFEHMEQVIFTLYYMPNSELDNLETNLWTYDCKCIEDFFCRLESMDCFKIPLDYYAPIKADVDQGEV